MTSIAPAKGADRLAPSDGKAVPRHVAIIMDGNGRWAQQRGLPRAAGHRAGAEAVRRALQAAADQGVEVLTIYAFSSENWRRTKEEISELTALMRYYLERELKTLEKEQVRLKLIGNYSAFGPELVERLERAVERTANNTRLTLVIALNLAPGRKSRPRLESWPGRSLRVSCRPPRSTNRRLQVSFRPRISRARPSDPNIWRGSAVQLPVVASGLCRAAVPGHTLAGL